MAKVANEYLPLSILGEFPSEWTEATLSQVCVQVTDGTHDSPKPQSIGGFPLVTGKAIKERNIDFSVTYNISDEDHKKVIERSRAERDDILFANIGNSIGDLVRVQTDKEFSIKNVALFKPDLTLINPRFLEYFLLSEIVQNFIKGSTRGSAQPFIGLGTLRGFPIALPPMEEQINIGNILGALDDRITLLRETNTTLEAIAQALFKSWFVDFDPVHAKQQGREPEGMDANTAARFPDSFEESELGLVPMGWRVGTIGENTSYLSRGVSPKYLEEGGVLVINQKCIRDYILDLSKARRHDPAQRKIDGRELSVGDILINSTGVGTLGRVAQVLYSDETMIVDSHVTMMRVNDDLTWNFLGLSMMQRQAEIEDMGEGSTGQTELSRSKLAALKLIVPSKEILCAFDNIVLPLRKKFATNLKQAQTLANLRDTLLPRLISGQLRLPESL